MAKIYDQEEMANLNVIAAGTTVTGNIVSNGDCRIDGTVKGNITSKSKVIIGQSGVLEGDIQCQSVEIEGTAKANITAADLISLKSTANLTGNISTGKISIEPGAGFAGNCKMQNHAVGTPQPAAPAKE